MLPCQVKHAITHYILEEEKLRSRDRGIYGFLVQKITTDNYCADNATVVAIGETQIKNECFLKKDNIIKYK